MSGAKLWGGRFRGNVDPIMEKFNESLSFDRRMWKADIQGSKAYALANQKAGVITAEEAVKICHGLDQVYKEWEEDKFTVKPGDEDIHTANERRLSELIGPVAGKLHTGRSRNDQVATDLRMWMRDTIHYHLGLMTELLGIMAQLAEDHVELLMPGFTHLQPAQPIRFSHWVLSHAFAIARDAERLQDLLKRVNVMPLGSGALAGNPFGIDRHALAKSLGFSDVSPNSLDAVCNRDDVAEYLFWASMTMVHISQLSEDLIVYNLEKFVTIADAYSTGSSLMPQKKNPDALELLRGKTGRVTGKLSGFLTTLKGLPRSYNKDLQEDKEALFDCVDTMTACLQITSGVLATLTPNAEGLKKMLVTEMLATELAEYLVRKGVPFRETHHVAGAAVRLAEDRKCDLSELTLEDLRKLHSEFTEDVMKVWDFEASVERKQVTGGTSKRSVLEQVQKIKSWIATMKKSS